MPTIVFYQDSYIVGGSETLILRLAKQLISNGFRTIILSKETICDETISRQIFSLKNSEYYQFDNTSKQFLSSSGAALCFTEEKVIVYVRSLISLINACCLLDSYKFKSKIVFRTYIIHPHFSWTNEKMADFIYRPWVRRMVKRHQMFFMDEITREEYIKHYNEDSYVSEKALIKRLPIIINDSIKFKEKKHNMSILTACRMDFPFKGYVIGLVQDFYRLLKKYNNIELCIIGDGPNKEELKKVVSSLPKVVQNKITLISNVSYDKLLSYINCADILIGMGTTVLDAVNINTISLVAVPYQMENLASSFFDDDFKNVGDPYDENKRYLTFYNEIEKIILMSNSDFIAKQKVGKRLLSEHYNIDTFIDELTRDDIPPFSDFDYLFSKVLNNYMRIILYVKKVVKKIIYKF